MMLMKTQFRFPSPSVEIIADIVYPTQKPLYDVITYINGIPIIVEPANQINPTIFKFWITEIFVNFTLSIS